MGCICGNETRNDNSSSDKATNKVFPKISSWPCFFVSSLTADHCLKICLHVLSCLVQRLKYPHFRNQNLIFMELYSPSNQIQIELTFDSQAVTYYSNPFLLPWGFDLFVLKNGQLDHTYHVSTVTIPETAHLSLVMLVMRQDTGLHIDLWWFVERLQRSDIRGHVGTHKPSLAD